MSSKAERFVIIGGDAAGMSAAMSIRRLLPQASIIVFEQTSYFSYAQCGLPYYISGQIPSTNNLIARTQAAFQEKYRIEAMAQHQVLSIDRQSKRVQIRLLETGKEYWEAYDNLLIATGASPIVPPWPGSKLNGVVTLKTIPDAQQLNSLLENAQKVAIIGGGFIGLELAEACRMRGKDVSVLDMAPQIAMNFDPEMAFLAQEELIRNQVSLYLQEQVVELQGHQGRVTQVVTNERSIPADLVIAAVGVAPNTDLARECGLELGFKNAIAVDETMKTSDSCIWAAGDCALHYHRIKKRGDYVPLGTTANKHGQTAGWNMAGEHRPFKGILGTAIIKVFDLALARTGLSTGEAQQLNLPFAEISYTARHRAGYYPDAKKLHLKILFNKETNALLGGQAVGEAGADKFIDQLSIALYNHMTIDQLEDLDLAYAPPFSPVWSPLQQGARLNRLRSTVKQ